MQRKLLVITSLFIANLACVASAKKPISEQEYFQRAFGKKSTSLSYAKEIEFRLILDQESLGNISVNLKDPPNATTIDANTLLTHLKTTLIDNYWQILNTKVQQGFLKIADLENIGIKVTTDNEKFILYIFIPLEIKKTKDITLTAKAKPSEFPVIPNAPVTGFINVRASDTFVMKTRNELDHNRLPLLANFDGSLNVYDYILEANVNFAERDTISNWRHGDVRLVHDIMPLGVRLSALDIGYETTTYQSFEKVLGINVATNFASKGIRNTSPSGKYGFILTKTSEVEVLVNEQVVYKKLLSPGEYNAQDFPFTSGANDVRIRITDQVGKKEELHFPFFYNYQLLRPGLHNFSYSFGIPETNVDNKRRFNTKQPTFTAFHRLGLTNFLTAGANFQHNNQQLTLGLDSLLEFALGSLQTEAAVSRIRQLPKGYAVTASYQKSIDSQTIGLRYQTRNRYFASVGNLEPNNLDRHNIAASYSFPFVADIAVGLSASVNYDRKWRQRTHSHRLTANKRLLPGMQLRATMLHRKELDRRSDIVYMLSINFIPPKSRSSFSAEYDSEKDNTTLEWDHAPLAPVHSLGTNVRNESSSKGDDNFDVTATYNFNRIESNLNFAARSDHGKYNIFDQRARLQLASGIAYADRQLGITKPVSNSFVMVATHKRLKGHAIDVEPVSDLYYAAQANAFGPAVVPSLSSYNERVISFDDSDFPVGQVLEGNTYTVKPRYKSGAIIRIGNNAIGMIQGRLFNTDAKPIYKMTMALVPKDGNVDIDKIPEDELFFSGKRGFFVKQGIEPGEYNLVLFNKKQTTFPVTIKEDEELLNLGTITAPEKYAE